jgi:hypothetical protein
MIKNAFDMFLTLKIGDKYKWFLNKNKKRFVSGCFFLFYFFDPDRSGAAPGIGAKRAVER